MSATRLPLQPFVHLFDTPVYIVSNLIYPKPHNIPVHFIKPVITNLVTITQFAGPVLMVHLAVNLNVKLTLTVKQGKVKPILFNAVYDI